MPFVVATKRRRWLVIGGAILLVLLLFVPLPLPIRDRHREAAVCHALDALLVGDRVLSNQGFRPLHDWSIVSSRRSSLYFTNGTDVSQRVFLSRGLRPVADTRKLNVDRGDVIVAFAPWRGGGRSLQFSYAFGSLGAQGYELRIYRSLLVTYSVFHHRLVS